MRNNFAISSRLMSRLNYCLQSNQHYNDGASFVFLDLLL